MGRLTILLEGLRALDKVGNLPGVQEAKDSLFLEVGKGIFRVWEEEEAGTKKAVKPSTTQAGRESGKRERHDWAAYAELEGISDRDRRIAEAKASGLSTADTAAQFSLSTARVSQIGKHLRAVLNGEAPPVKKRGPRKSAKPEVQDDAEESSPVAA